MPAQRFEIIDGVRRAKAAEIEGHLAVWAIVYPNCSEQRIPVKSLLSPKRVIDAAELRELQRWQNVIEAMRTEPDLLPPIAVRRGRKGIPIKYVQIIGPWP